MDEMFKEFEFNEKPKQMITNVNGLALPEDYLAFMREHNGGEGPLGENNYGRFYRLEELRITRKNGSGARSTAATRARTLTTPFPIPLKRF